MGSFQVEMKASLERIEGKLDRWQRLTFSALAGLTIALLVTVLGHM